VATKLKIKKGDSVQVLTGKDAGKRGTVLRMVPEQRRLVVEKVNMVSGTRSRARPRASPEASRSSRAA
jgi:ribosomal protein L24